MENKDIHKEIQNKTSELKNQYMIQIQRFFEEHRQIMNLEKPLSERLELIKELISKYTLEQNDETSRTAQREHKNNDSPLARNRIIIQAELNQHMMNYDNNWDHNTDHAEGKYTSKLKDEWLEKKAKLESELKNSVN